MGLFSTKNVSDLQAEAEGSHGLKRALTATNLVFLGIGAIIGAGIFVLTGQVAATVCRPGHRPVLRASPAPDASSRVSATPSLRR